MEQSTNRNSLFIVLLPICFGRRRYGNRSFIQRVYCRGILCPDTWGHGYQIDDRENDLDKDNGSGSGGAVATDDPLVAEELSFTIGDHSPPLEVILLILSCRDAPSLSIKWRQEARIL